MIEFRNVSMVYYKNVKALTNVYIYNDKGEFVFLVGPSGAGKSTFIKMLLKEVEPSTGNIVMGNEDLSKIKRRQIPYHRRKIGMVFQDFRLIPTLNVYENEKKKKKKKKKKKNRGFTKRYKKESSNGIITSWIIW